MSTMTLLLLSAALAAPPGYKVTKTTNDCELMLGPAEADGVVPMRAECHWPEIPPDAFHAAVGNFAIHGELWSTVPVCEVVRTEGGRTLTHQVHQSNGISDRELMLWLETVEVEGGYRHQWTRAVDEPLEPAKGNVAAARDDGYCEGVAHPDGGTQVNYQLSYDPGGKVPGFLVRWFQTSGLAGIMEDLRTSLGERLPE